MHNPIKEAAQIIQQGGVVAFPTETVYGLGANALNPYAVAKIFEIKQRPTFDPLIVHISSIDELELLTINKDKRIFELAEKFWPGPLTIIVPKSKNVPDIVTAGLPTVGIRMPNHPIALELIKESKCPIAAPSANKFGKTSPTSAYHVKKQLKGIDFIIDGGKTTVGIESTIIRLNDKGFEILRYGIITAEEIEKVIPHYQENITNEQILASGMMKSHYAPNKPLYILGQQHIPFSREQSGLIAFSTKDVERYAKVIYVSENHDLKEYAIHLFSSIHELEESEVQCIVAEPVPEEGIGLAIMDRLKKASYKNFL